MKPGYELIEHTADTGLRIYAPDLKGVFVLAAKGLFDIMIDIKTVRPRQTHRIEVEAADTEELFMAWLRELVFLFSARRMALGRFDIEKLIAGDTEKKAVPPVSDHEFSEQPKGRTDQLCRLKAAVYGETLDLERHKVKTEVKAVTYHQLKIERKKSMWTAEVIFDI